MYYFIIISTKTPLLTYRQPLIFASPLRVGIEHTQGEGPNAYVTATIAKTAPVPEEPTPPVAPESSSDSD